MNRPLSLLVVAALPLLASAQVKTYEGTLTVPTYEHGGREMQPPLFASSTVTGLYPFPTYLPFQEGGPKPHTYRAVFVENEYLKLTYIPEFGGRIFSLYDKIRKREVFYRNDVIKSTPYNPRLNWPQSGLELTGPYDVHMLTLNAEPHWSHTIVRAADGAVSLVLSEIDPVYQMKVNLTATLYPGIAAMQISVSCYNPRDAIMPQMFWINTAVPTTPKTRFIYPMTRTVGHTTADIADWPVFNGVDYSWDRNNQNMLGVFGIDIYDNFHGAFQSENNYGVLRWADRRLVQGMKLWTWGHGPGAKEHERAYTDHAGPYVELQSGRHVWDGHYEWVAPHRMENWSEWWIPVAGTAGVTTLTRDVALNLTAEHGTLSVALASTRVVKGARLAVRSATGEIATETIDLDPAKPVQKTFPADKNLAALRVVVSDAKGGVLLDYLRPDSNPGRQEYTPFTRPLEQPRKAPEDMGAEELTLAAEYRFKELDDAGARALLDRALARDPGYSRAHLLRGIHEFIGGRPADAIPHLEKAIARDPYLSEAYYYLASSQLALGRAAQAERNLYYIWPDSAYFGLREYHLGRLRLLEHKHVEAIEHLRRAVLANGMDLTARLTLAVAYREAGRGQEARETLTGVAQLDPSNVLVEAERFLGGGVAARVELNRLLGGQSQEALSVSIFYRDLQRWREAVRLLRVTAEENHDPWGTPAEFYYTLAYCQRRAEDPAGAAASLAKARTAGGNVDRFPYRRESEAPLAEAVQLAPGDAVARASLARLLYHLSRPKEAIEQWEAAVELSPDDFSLRRELGLAYSEQSYPVEKAAAQLERAIALQPSHLRTLNDLSVVYARAGRFDEQAALLARALERSPGDDDLAEGVLTAHVIQGRYDDAMRLLEAHHFAVRHRSYGLRDKYRVLRYGMGARAMREGDFAAALAHFEAALKPPASLGVDDFATQSSPRLDTYIGLALDALGRTAEARQAYQRAIAGIAQLTGDRDSWNSENFYMLLALDHLGRGQEAAALGKRFENFAITEKGSRNPVHRSEALYLLALIGKRDKQYDGSRKLLQQALDAKPDLLGPRLELRGDVPDPLTAPAR